MTEPVVTTIAEVTARVASARAERKSVGLVPTMGALHEGHLTLIRRAKAECGLVAVSIFVNPTQFAPGTDFEKYPRDLDGDATKAVGAGADLIFAPAVDEMYPPGDSTFVEVTGQLVDCLCGPFRPGHFRGVTTVCARLFNIVGADRAYFGEKDYQQLLVIKQMVRDLKFALEIVPVPTVREADGLAMSSRNAYLSPDERRAATVLHRALSAARKRIEAGDRDPASIISLVRQIIATEPLATLQYVELRDAETLAAVPRIDGRVVIALAAFLSSTRLIDNVVV